MFIQAFEMGCQSFILKVFKDTWVQRLRDPDSLYTCVAAIDILYLLLTYSSGIECADVVTMFDTMHLW